MQNRIQNRFFLLLLTVLFLSSSPIQSQTAETKSLATILDRASGQDLRGLVELAKEVRKLGDEPGQIEQMEKALETASPEERLVLGRAFLDLEESEKALKALLPLLDSKVAENFFVPATRFLSHPSLIKNKDLEAKLNERLSGSDLSSNARMEVTLTLYKIGSGESRLKARTELKSFLKSEEVEVRVQGALALAEIGDLESSRDELKKLSDQPNLEGKFAKAFLDREEIERLYERKIKNIEDFYKKQADTAAPGKTLDPSNVLLLEEVIKNVQHAHIRGELFTKEELIAAAARGLLNLLDPYSTYLPGDEYKRFVFDINQDYGGIGAFVRNINNVFTILRPIYSGPAYKIGLRSDDKILAVDGWETTGKGEDEIIKRLKGKPGTPVKVTVYRSGWADSKEFDVVRQKINIPVLQYELFPGGIGYVELISFSRDSAEELESAIAALKTKGMQALILDLRNDPGGLLESAVAVSENFLPKNSLVVYTDSRLEGKKEYRTERSSNLPQDFPLIVLVNDRSASASEIVAGALQFHGRATIVGEQSYGKGSVQTLFPVRSLPDEPFADENHNGRFDDWEKYTDLNRNNAYDYGPRIKLTIARYFFPNGKSIHTETDKLGRVTAKGGVTPDVEVEFQDLDRFKLEELERVLTLKGLKDPKVDRFREYVQKHFHENPASKNLFIRLAEGDGKDTNAYPEFESFYQSLETALDRNEIRRWLRLRVREAVSDERGRVFPGERFLGDYEEDSQLQKAIEVLLGKLGRNVNEIPEYKTAFVTEKKTQPEQKKGG